MQATKIDSYYSYHLVNNIIINIQYCTHHEFCSIGIC